MPKSAIPVVAAIAIALCSAGAYARSRTVSNPGLPPYTIVGDAIPAPLTSVPGDPKRGEAIVRNSKLGSCLSCHKIPIADAADPGDVGPPLAGVGRQLSAGQLRLRVVDMKAIDPTTIMPSFYRTYDLHDVAAKFDGKPILQAQQVEDVVAFLQTLK
jgi:sulfur-oxidizing protein SoxX